MWGPSCDEGGGQSGTVGEGNPHHPSALDNSAECSPQLGTADLRICFLMLGIKPGS